MEITGKIEIDGRTVEFLISVDGLSGNWNQWSPEGVDLGPTVGLLEGLSAAADEWANNNLCSECHDALLDDGEGYDGLCGTCADRAEEDDDE